MARKHGGLGRGLDALIPQVIPMYPPQSGAEGDGSRASTEVFFSDEEEMLPVEEPVKEPAAEGPAVIPAAEGPAGSPAVTEPAEAEEISADTGDKAPAPDRETGSSQSGAAVLVRISQVEPNRKQPREVFDEEALEELADSIKRYGILQPLLVQDRGDHYEIIAGERRWRAALKAGLHEIPVVIREYTEQEITELSLIENIQREDLNPIEEAQAYQRLLEEFGLKQEEVAQRVSRSRTAITNALRLLKLEERVRRMLADGALTMGQARPLLALTIPEEQYRTACRIAEEGLSAREVEKLVRELTGENGRKSTRKAREKSTGPDPQLQAIYKQLEERMKNSLQTKVRILDKGSGSGHLEIDFYGTEDLERLIDKIV